MSSSCDAVLGAQAAVLAVLLLGLDLVAQDVDPSRPSRTDPGALRGHPSDQHRGQLFVCGGGGLPPELYSRFVHAAGGPDARLVVIPTASSRAADESRRADGADRWRQRGIRDVTYLHAGTAAAALDPDFVEPLRRATAVWFDGGSQSRIADAYVGSPLVDAVLALLERDGTVGGTSAGAACMSRVMIAGGKPDARVGTGLGLLPGTVIDQHFSERGRQERLRRVLGRYPGRVGLGIDEGTAIVVRGRELTVFGRGQVSVFQVAGGGRPGLEARYGHADVLDLVQLRRAARMRTQAVFPPREDVDLQRGTVLMAGGGRVPRAVLQRFVDGAGGTAKRFVVVSTATGRRVSRRHAVVQTLEQLGCTNVEVWHAETRDDADDPQLCEALDEAHGLWFTGGQQWRLVDRYDGTLALHKFRGVLERGGIIGGSSAGASILGRYLVRGHPLDTAMRAEGYEAGFAFLPGVAIDQHFTQRGREPEFAALIEQLPMLLGVGIDEGTALVVSSGAQSEVVGQHRVTILDRRGGGEAVRTVLEAGDRFDLRR